MWGGLGCGVACGVGVPQVDHPVILTEAPCNPTQCRARTAELMFEAYGVPGLGMPQEYHV